jgi:hypothetical protein
MSPKAWLPVVLCSILLGMQGASASAALPEFSKTGLSLSAESASASLETTNGLKIKCGASVAKGEVTGAKTIRGYQQTYKGCAMGSIKCASLSQNPHAAGSKFPSRAQ